MRYAESPLSKEIRHGVWSVVCFEQGEEVVCKKAILATRAKTEHENGGNIDTGAEN